jgi:hypothetical protein
VNLTNSFRTPRRLFRKAVQQGRSTRRGEAYSLLYVEPLSTARTPLADFVNSLLEIWFGRHRLIKTFLNTYHMICTALQAESIKMKDSISFGDH